MKTIQSEQTHLVPLDADHPGFRDPHYRARRDAIANQALEHTRGELPPYVDYTEAEQGVWRTVWDQLGPLHERLACRRVVELTKQIAFADTPIPQLAELDRLLRIASDFSMQPVAGLVTPRDFLEALAERTFLSTQYIRHPSAPLYTPEPDLIHEYVGHVTTLLDQRIADLHEAIGRAALRADEARMAQLERVYWYTMEFGLVEEAGEPKAFGAGLLSSVGELGAIQETPEIRPLDLQTIATFDYDPTQQQPVLFMASSFEHMIGAVGEWLA